MSIGREQRMPIARGDLFWVDFGEPRGSEQGGRRPAVVVSTDDLNAVSSVVIVAAITKTLPSGDRPQHVFLPAGTGGLTTEGMVKADQLITVSRDRLGERHGRLSPGRMNAVDAALFYVLGLDDADNE